MLVNHQAGRLGDTPKNLIVRGAAGGEDAGAGRQHDAGRRAPGRKLPTSLSPSRTGILPGPGTTGGTRVGGQTLLLGGVTTPSRPAQQILAGIVNTADPYAACEQTILTTVLRRYA